MTVTDWIQAVATSVAVVVAVVAVRAAFAQVGQGRELREEQAQPYVVVDFEPDPATGHPFMDLVIKNSGLTAARNVKFLFEPPLESAFYESTQGVPSIADISILREGIPTMPPGRAYRITFDHMPERHEKGLQNRYKVTVSFESSRKKEQPLVYELDLDVYYGGMLAVSNYGLHHIAKSLRGIAEKIGVTQF